MSAPTAIVTGASRGLGLALAAALAQRGWRLVIDARDADELEAARAQLAQHGAEVLAIPGDVADAGHRGRLLWRPASGSTCSSTTPARSAPSPLPTLADLPARRPRAHAARQRRRPARAGPARAAAHAGGRAVVDVTSDAAVEAYEGWGGYGSSKAALDQLSNVLAAERPDLRVYAVDPGDMHTRMHQDAFPGEDISDRPPPETIVPGLLALIEGDVRQRPVPRGAARRRGSCLTRCSARRRRPSARASRGAREPPEARGLARDAVRMLVAERATG